MAIKSLLEMAKIEYTTLAKDEAEAWEILLDEQQGSTNRNAAAVIVNWCITRRQNVLNFLGSAAQLELQKRQVGNLVS